MLYFSAALSGCNAAMSDRPLFDEAQRSSALILEDGLWVEVDPDCKVDVKTPSKHWPKCAEWVVLSGNKVVRGRDSKADEDAIDLFIVDGTPPIIQSIMNEDASNKQWLYLAFAPESFSPPHRLTALRLWPVPCGTEDPADPDSMKVLPFPGFNQDCRTTSVKALRDAAARPLPKDDPFIRWRWVRSEAP